MTAILQQVGLWLESENIKFGYDKKEEKIYMSIHANKTAQLHFIYTEDDGDTFIWKVIATHDNLPIALSEEKYLYNVLLHINYMNSKIKFGTWTYHPDEKILFLITKLPIEDTTLTKQQLLRIYIHMTKNAEQGASDIYEVLETGKLENDFKSPVSQIVLMEKYYEENPEKYEKKEEKLEKISDEIDELVHEMLLEEIEMFKDNKTEVPLASFMHMNKEELIKTLSQLKKEESYIDIEIPMMEEDMFAERTINIFPKIKKELGNDRDVVFAIMEYDGMLLQYAPKEFQNDKEIVSVAVKKSSFALEFASKELLDDKALILWALNDCPWGLLDFASDRLKDDKEVVLLAVKGDGSSLKDASIRLKNDKEVVLAAVKESESSLKYASKEMQYEIAKEHKEYLQYISE